MCSVLYCNRRISLAYIKREGYLKAFQISLNQKEAALLKVMFYSNDFEFFTQRIHAKVDDIVGVFSKGG